MNTISDKNNYKCKIKMKNIDYYYIILNQKMSENILKFFIIFWFKLNIVLKKMNDKKAKKHKVVD